MTPQATVVITTKNRKDELANAIRSVLAQNAPVDILVIDDGSTDGTYDFVRQQFPSVRIDRSEQSRGYIVHRNRAAQLTSAPIIISIDDDAILPSPGTIRQTLADFDHPRIGAVAIPYIDVKFGPKIYDRPPDQSLVWVVSSYRGTAHALRRDLFLQLGGYQSYLFHQGEEQEYCIRLLNAGFVVRAGRAAPLHHLASPKRDLSRICKYSARNNLLFSWYNAPMPQLLGRLLLSPIGNVRYGIKNGQLWATLQGIAGGYGAMVHEFAQRQPVTRNTFRLYRKLFKCSSMRLEAIEAWPGFPACAP